MTKLLAQTQIEAPAEQVWTVVGTHFAAVDQWSSTVEESRPLRPDEVPPDISADPRAPVPGRETVSRLLTAKEVLVDYSAEQRQFTFDVAHPPRALKSARNTTHVTGVGDGRSQITFDVDFELAAPMKLFAPLLRRRMQKTFKGVQVDLKTFVEKGMSVEGT